MTVRVLGLESGVTSLEDHRMLLQLFQQPNHSDGILHRRSGIVPSSGAADLTTASAMQADIAAFVAWIDGTTTADQAGYPFVSDATETLTFSDGDATNDRIDRVVAQIRDDPYDGSGETDGRVVIVEGTAASSPSPPAIPASSIPLYRVDVAAGTSAGSGGIDFGADVTDDREYLTLHRDPEEFTSGGTWTNPQDGFKAIRVRLCGSGGCGGGAEATGGSEGSCGSGGSAGVYAESVIPAGDLGSSETVTVGAAVSGTSAAAGSPGNSTSFGSHVSASGGTGGPMQGATGGINVSAAASTATGGTGDVTVPGAPGTPGVIFGFNISGRVVGGNGGSGPLGGGGEGVQGGDGSDGMGFGAGGGGASNHGGQVARTGGSSAPGVVIVDYLY